MAEDESPIPEDATVEGDRTEEERGEGERGQGDRSEKERSEGETAGEDRTEKERSEGEPAGEDRTEREQSGAAESGTTDESESGSRFEESTVETGPITVPPVAGAGVLPPERTVEAPIGAVRQVIRAEREAEGADIPEDVQKYDRFKKVDGSQYERVNQFLRDRTYITAREWAIARLCSDFRTETGIEMTKIGENLPHLVPFMTDTYTPQAVNQARASFETKVRKSGATFLYGAMSDFFTADELDDIMYEVTEVAKFLLEVEGVDLAVDEELEGEERISSVMREVRSASDELRHEGTQCPNCGHEIGSE